MTPQEYLEQIFELEEKVDASMKKRVSDNPHPSCSINGKKIARLLELTQEINELVDKRADLKLKYGTRMGYKV